MNLSMLEKLISFFASKTKGYITKTQLVKFLYLADLYAVKWTEKQLTDLDWYYYTYGPWHEDIEQVLQQMCTKKMIEIVSQEQTLFVKPSINCPTVEQLHLSKSLELMLRNIQKEWAGITSSKINDLLEYVYQTQPMIEVKTNYKPEEKVALNLHLEHEKLIQELGV